MYSLRTTFFSISGTTLLMAFFSCSVKSQKITHLDFLDIEGKTYKIMDSTHKNPINDMSMYFLVNRTELKNIDFGLIEKFISTDSFIQNKIQRFSEVSITVYKESKNTKYLIKSKSSKYLSLCNDDIVVEYLWADGKPSDTLYYENGQINGSEKIRLLNIRDTTKN